MVLLYRKGSSVPWIMVRMATAQPARTFSRELGTGGGGVWIVLYWVPAFSNSCVYTQGGFGCETTCLGEKCLSSFATWVRILKSRDWKFIR